MCTPLVLAFDHCDLQQVEGVLDAVDRLQLDQAGFA